jgi:DNA-binding response OmpR family regulator
MVSLLIVDDDLQLRKALTRALKVYGFEVDAAGGCDEALTCLAQKPYDVVITDLRMGERNGLDLLAALRDSPYRARPILMSAYASAKDSQRALELGAVRVLCKPFEIREVLDAIERALESSTGYIGMVHGLSLIDMLQMFHYGRRSLSLEVLGKAVATISLENGEIVDARFGIECGELALRSILSLPSGSLQTRSLQAFTHSIHRSFQNLLLDLLREVDEQSLLGPRTAAASSPANGECRVSSQPRIRSEAPLSLSPDAESVRPSPRRPRPPRAELEVFCRDIVAQVSGALCCDVIDLLTTEVLGSHGAIDPSSRAPLPTAALVQLFRSAPDAAGADGREPETHFDELQLSARERLYFAKALASHQALVVVSAPGGAELALGWAQLRGALPPLDDCFVRLATGAARGPITTPPRSAGE